MIQENKWFSISVLFEGIHTPLTKEPKWEDIIYLVKAKNSDEAEKKTLKIASENETEYDTIDGGKVKWVFRGVSQVFEIMVDELESGVELFSRHLKQDEAKSLLKPFED